MDKKKYNNQGTYEEIIIFLYHLIKLSILGKVFPKSIHWPMLVWLLLNPKHLEIIILLIELDKKKHKKEYFKQWLLNFYAIEAIYLFWKNSKYRSDNY